jgi:four helix bundle protein
VDVVDETTFKLRTRGLGLSVIALVRSMRRDLASEVIARQVVRSATSVGANYRAACRAKSSNDMLAKLAIVEEEADETAHWLEMLRDSNSLSAADADPLIREANEITAMTVASIRTLRARSRSIQNPKSKIQNG